MTAAVRPADEFEQRLARYILERSEENRAVRVGEKEVSEQAAIVARFADLFTTEQLAALAEAEDAASTPDDRERLHRLRRTCEAGVVVTRLAPLQDALANAELATDVELGGERLPLRAATARLATLSDYGERDELGDAAMDASATLNDRRLELTRAGEALQAELSGEPDPVARHAAEKGISLRDLSTVLADASAQMSGAYDDLRERWLDRLLGASRAPVPSAYHAPFVLRLTLLADLYSKERATEVCVSTLRDLGLDLETNSNIRTDLEDRPQKAPRPAVIAADPPRVVHLITRPLGGLQDYQNFLHEAGHAHHYAGCEPALPLAFRLLARDFALTEIYAYVVQAVTREPAWHARYFGLSAGEAQTNAEVTRFLDAFMFRRFLAKFQFELDFWSRFGRDGGTSGGYAERLSDATGFRYREDRYLADMDPGFYSADYLRAWIRSAQLRSHLLRTVGEDWWCRSETGAFLRRLFLEGTRPSNEDIAERIGFEPFDTRPLVADMTATTLPD